jgi:hypothetical protein
MSFYSATTGEQVEVSFKDDDDDEEEEEEDG